MAAPWEKYQQPAPAPAAAPPQAAPAGPWARYQAPAQEVAPQPPVDAAAASPVQPAKPSLFGMGSDFADMDKGGVGQVNIGIAALKDMFGSRLGAAEYLAEQSGGKVETDADGEPVVVLASGDRYRLNNAGLDTTDVGNVAGNVAAFFSPAAWVNRINQARNAGMAVRAGSQAATAIGVDTGLQVGFDNGRIDPLRTGLAGIGGAAGEVIAPVLGKIIQAVRGAPAPQAPAALLRELGITKPTPQQTKEATEAVAEIAAGGDPAAVIGAKEFGFRYTQGQRTLDPVERYNQLGREEVLRQQPGANAPFIQAEQANQNALSSAVEGIAARWGARPGATAGELSTTVQGRVAAQADELKGRISEAYDVAGQSNRTAVRADAVQALPRRLAAAVTDFDMELTPAAAQTLKRITNLASSLPEGTAGVTLRAIETQRKIINNSIAAAASNPADRAAMTAIKREFDGWVDNAVDDALLSGDPAALDAIKKARGLRAEFGRRFEGDAQADRFVADLVVGQKTPEELLNVALGAGQVSKAAGGRFVDRLRLAVGDDPETLGALRAAQFLRMVQKPTGEPLGPQAIVNNILRMEVGNRSMIDALYSPAEWKEVKRLAAALKPMVPPSMIAKSSGTAERVMRYLSTSANRLPFVGKMAEGIAEVKNGIQAERVFTQPVRPPMLPANPLLPAAGAAGGSQGAPPLDR